MASTNMAGVPPSTFQLRRAPSPLDAKSAIPVVRGKNAGIVGEHAGFIRRPCRARPGVGCRSMRPRGVDDSPCAMIPHGPVQIIHRAGYWLHSMHRILESHSRQQTSRWVGCHGLVGFRQPQVAPGSAANDNPSNVVYCTVNTANDKRQTANGKQAGRTATDAAGPCEESPGKHTSRAPSRARGRGRPGPLPHPDNVHAA
jgi:hypothetical protein